jgi:hypothetical protein
MTPAEAGLAALGKVAILPAILTVIFLGLLITRRRTASSAEPVST